VTRPILDSARHPPAGRSNASDPAVDPYQGTGEPSSGKQGPGTQQYAWCPVCLGELAASPEKGADARHFKHRFAQDEARCPLSTASYQPDGLNISQARDGEVERHHRKAFVDLWSYHYAAMKQLAPSLTMQRFTRLVEYSDVLNLWSCRELEQRDLPYVLLALADFMIEHGRGPLTWVRFCFDARVRELGDLWKPGGLDIQFFKMQYREPAATPFPTAKQLQSWEAVPRSAGFLDEPPPRLNVIDVQMFRRFLTSRPPGPV
jgi:hypothetical protein